MIKKKNQTGTEGQPNQNGIVTPFQDEWRRDASRKFFEITTRRYFHPPIKLLNVSIRPYPCLHYMSAFLLINQQRNDFAYPHVSASCCKEITHRTRRNRNHYHEPS